MGRQKPGEREERVMIQGTNSCVKNGGGSVMTRAWKGPTGDYWWRDRWLRYQDEFWGVSSWTLLTNSQMLQNGQDGAWQCRWITTFWRHRNAIMFKCQVSQLISTRQSSFSVTGDKAGGRKTHKQLAAEGSSTEGLVKASESECGDAHGLRTWVSHWLQRVFMQVLTITVTFTLC